jgi:hypothetical protein
MGFYEDLAIVARDPAIMRLAIRRARSRELAEDALQETYWNVVKKDPTVIDDLRAYFIRALVREIDHQRARSTAIPVEDVAAAGEREAASSRRPPSDSVEHEAEIRKLAQTVLSRLETDHGQLMAAVPGRSPNPQYYRTAVVAAARKIFLMLLQGWVASADWNAALKSAYPLWFAGVGLAPDAVDQRLSRGRSDVRMLLRRFLAWEELGLT